MPHSLLRWGRRPQPIWLVLLLSLLVGCPRVGKTLYELTERPQPGDPDEPALVLEAKVRIYPDLLVPGQPVKVEFYAPRATKTLALEPVDPARIGLRRGHSAWTARTPDGNQAFITKIDGLVDARVPFGAEVYQLHSTSAREGSLKIYDTSKFREHPKRTQSGARGSAGGTAVIEAACADPTDVVDIMVYYTEAAAVLEPNIESTIQSAIYDTNQAYINSELPTKLNLVHIGPAPDSYVEPEKPSWMSENEWSPEGLLIGDLATENGYLESVPADRATFGADLVSLVYAKGDKCGAPTPLTELASAQTTDEAFTVVRRSCLLAYLSLAHETGHNLGARHDKADAGAGLEGQVVDLGDNYGYIDLDLGNSGLTPWRTIMSYAEPCNGCPRFPWYSNPEAELANGVSAGSSEANNARAIELNWPAVSRYRCRQTSTTADVWMKDRWEDEGGEPTEPATAGKPMWESPYIWLRQTQDARLEDLAGNEANGEYLHEHDHQNPEHGQPNFVYVKVHNTGGADQTRDLEVYWAESGINGPESWSLLESKEVTIPAGTVDVVEFKWANVPAPGHYCIIARWNVENTVLDFTGSTSVSAAVYADNDLIWRNMNIVNLSPDQNVNPVSSVVFAMAPDEEGETYLLITTKPLSQRKIDWKTLLVDASISVDEKLITHGFRSSVGLKQKPRRGELSFALDAQVKLIGPFKVGRGQKPKVTLTTTTNPAAVKRAASGLYNPADYKVTVMQIRSQVARFASDPSTLIKRDLVLGGVTYILRVPAGARPRK